MTEAKITIGGIELTQGQSMAVRMALYDLAFQLQDKKFRDSLGPLGIGVADRVQEVMEMIRESA